MPVFGVAGFLCLLSNHFFIPWQMNLKNSAFLLILLVAGLLSGCHDDNIISPPDDNYLPSDYTGPSWSPDGKKIAYYHENYENDSTYSSGLYLIDISGANRVMLVPGFANSPHWSPNGAWIVFSNDGMICVIKPNGDSLIGLVGGDFPRWSPDGENIAYGRSGTQDTVGLWIYNLRHGTKHRVGYGGDVDWSPDGTKFVSTGGPSTNTTEGQIWIMDTSGNNRRQLTTNTFRFNRSPRWSQDGKTIAWTTLPVRTDEIWLMGADGSNQRKLTEGSYGAFSPDCRRLVFSRINTAKTNYDLWKINSDGTNLKQI
jgi:TolB protein